MIVLRKKGESVELHQEPVSSMAKFLGKFIPSAAENNRNYHDYKIKSKDGKTIGTATTNRISDKEINLVWISISGRHGGKGHGQSAMRTILEQARKDGYKYVTLEVPTTSPNAKHIYEKLGFKETGETLGDEDDIWGGLTKMKLKL